MHKQYCSSAYSVTMINWWHHLFIKINKKRKKSYYKIYRLNIESNDWIKWQNDNKSLSFESWGGRLVSATIIKYNNTWFLQVKVLILIMKNRRGWVLYETYSVPIYVGIGVNYYGTGPCNNILGRIPVHMVTNLVYRGWLGTVKTFHIYIFHIHIYWTRTP